MPRAAASLRRSSIILLPTVALSLALSGAALADPDEIAALDAACGADAAREEGRCVAVRIDHLRRLPLERPVGTLMIGNPAIADATMISATEAVITAKSVGSTNMIFIGQDGAVIADLEILVLESPERRVMLRRGPTAVANYQCAPRCERTLSLSDSPDAHTELTSVISRENSMVSEAVNASTPPGQ